MADKDSRQGKHYADAAILAWTESVHAGHDGGLAGAFAAPEKEGMPAIQVGPAEGKFLEVIARLIGARRALEVGTLAGYSAIRTSTPKSARMCVRRFRPRRRNCAAR